MTHANARQVGGNHYSASVQHWDIAAVYLLGHFEGNITKYVSRHAKKNKAQDVEKALHYIDKLIELFVQGKIQPVHLDYPHLPGRNANGVNPVQQWCTDMGLPSDETMVINKMCLWRTHVDLVRVRSLINAILQRYTEAGPCVVAPDIGDEPGPGYVNQDAEGRVNFAVGTGSPDYTADRFPGPARDNY